MCLISLRIRYQAKELNINPKDWSPCKILMNISKKLVDNITNWMVRAIATDLSKKFVDPQNTNATKYLIERVYQ